ncbi:MAG TPA: AMP-binding protein [Tepidisphaeraceae bacterium]|nr:AMP-binding protein [Tepidisphaeraceae bacterium]
MCSQFLRNFTGWQERCPPELPSWRSRNCSCHPGQRHRHRRHHPAPGPATQGRRPQRNRPHAAAPNPPPAIAPKFPSPSADDLAVLMYTSGTSGLPKGVMLTYGNLQSDVDACIVHANLQRQYTFIGVIPLFHAFGMTAMMLAPVQLGAPIVYMSRFSPMGALQALRKNPIAVMFGVPSMYAALLRMTSAQPEDFQHMFAALSGGEPLPAALRDGWKQRFGQPLYEGYGLTETSPVISLNTPVMHRPGSVGRTVPGVQVRVVDDNGNPLPPDQIGEIWLKGPMIMKGYYNLPQETANALTADGFFKTGDLGKVDADGFLYITGRKKDLVIVAGEKVSPREVEEVLSHHPAIAEAAVIGKKDASRGEVVAAFVVARPDATVRPDEVRAFCRDQGLAQHKIPREIVVLPDLPRSPTGKVLKRILIEQANGGPK